MHKSILSFIVVGALIVSFTACNNPEQPNIQFKLGSHLHINGPAAITLPPDTTTADTTDRLSAFASYSVVYGTVKKRTNGAFQEMLN